MNVVEKGERIIPHFPVVGRERERVERRQRAKTQLNRTSRQRHRDRTSVAAAPEPEHERVLSEPFQICSSLSFRRFRTVHGVGSFGRSSGSVCPEVLRCSAAAY